MAGSGIGKDLALIRVGHGEDDVVEGGRAVGRDVAGQRHHLVLRAFHRRQLLDRGLERPPRADRHDDRLDRAKPPLDLGGGRRGDPERRRGGVRIARHHLDQIEREPRSQAGAEVEAAGDRMVDPDLDEAFRNGKRHQPLRGLPGDAELAGDLILRVAGDVVEPAGAGRLVQPGIALPKIHRLATRCRQGRRWIPPPLPLPTRGRGTTSSLLRQSAARCGMRRPVPLPLVGRGRGWGGTAYALAPFRNVACSARLRNCHPR